MPSSTSSSSSSSSSTWTTTSSSSSSSSTPEIPPSTFDTRSCTPLSTFLSHKRTIHLVLLLPSATLLLQNSRQTLHLPAFRPNPSSPCSLHTSAQNLIRHFFSLPMLPFVDLHHPSTSSSPQVLLVLPYPPLQQTNKFPVVHPTLQPAPLSNLPVFRRRRVFQPILDSLQALVRQPTRPNIPHLPTHLHPSILPTLHTFLAAHVPNATLTPLRNWPLSLVLRVVSSPVSPSEPQCSHILKVTPMRRITPSFPATSYDEAICPDLAFPVESDVLHYLQQHYKDLIPPLEAFQPEHGISLTTFIPTSFQKATHEASPNLAEHFVDSLVKMQKHAANHVTQLLEAGWADRRLTRLTRLVKHARQKSQLQNLPQLSATFFHNVQMLCAQVQANYAPCDTIIHSDLHHNNLLVVDDEEEGEGRRRLVAVDWAESCVSHPIFEYAAMSKAFRSKYFEQMVLHDVWQLGSPLVCVMEFITSALIHDFSPTHWPVFGRQARNALRRAVEHFDPDAVPSRKGCLPCMSGARSDASMSS